MNTVEKTSTGVTPAELILNNSIRLSARILTPPKVTLSSGQIVLSDTMVDWIAKQYTLITLAQEKQLQSDSHALVQYDDRITEYPVHAYVLFTPPVGRSDNLLPRHHSKSLTRRTQSIPLGICLAASESQRIFTTYVRSTTTRSVHLR